MAGPLEVPGMPETLLVGLPVTSHDANNNTYAVFEGYGPFAYEGCTITVTEPPQSQTVMQGLKATFTAAASVSGAPASELDIQWQRSDDGGVSWVDLPGANRASYTTGFLTQGADDQAQFRVVFAVSGCTATSEAAVLTVAPDTVGPRLVSALGVGADRVVLLFNEPLDPGSADPFNFDIQPGILLAGAEMGPEPTRIDLLVDASTPLVVGTSYTLSASGPGLSSGVRDLAQNPIDPDPTVVTFLAQDTTTNDVANLVILPTANMLPVGSLSQRGFDQRWVQVGVSIPNDNDFAEALLAGLEALDAASGLPLPNLVAHPCTVETNIINYHRSSDTGDFGRIAGDVVFPGRPSGSEENIAAEFLMYLELEPHRMYRLSVNSDDGYRVMPSRGPDDPANGVILSEFNGGRGSPGPGADIIFPVAVPEAGLYPIRLIWEQGGGGANVEFWEQTGPSTYVAVNAAGGIPAYRPPAPPAPTLSVVRDGANVQISWPLSAITYCLVGTDSLDAPITWAPVAARAVQANGLNTVTIPADQARAYYQLVRLP